MKKDITKYEVINSALKCFESKGIKLSILDIAQDLNTSKRTIYNFFDSKDSLLYCAIDYVFDDIERQHLSIISEDIDSLVKLKRILSVYPAVINIDNLQIDKIAQLNPPVYELIVNHFATKWELTLEVYERCKTECLIRDFSSDAFRATMLGVYEQVMHFANHHELLIECIDMVFAGLEINN